MIRISQIKIPLPFQEASLERQILQILKIRREELLSWKLIRRSVDARKKPQLFYVCTVDVQAAGERKLLNRARKTGNRNIIPAPAAAYQLPPCGTEKLSHRPVIAGSGPAGLFCAWLLAKAGYQPLILERGDEAAVRKQKVDAFWAGGPLDTQSNVQFGEGGAGTFSDGKLNTSVKDPAGRNRKVLELFVEAGAPEQILWDQKPHLGTDLLITIITTLRRQIEDMGGEFCFRSQVTDLETEGGRLSRIQINHSRWIDAQVLVAAIGHSARDTFAMLKERGAAMEAKSFAVGVRIEHPQSMINFSQYGVSRQEELGAASYKLTCQLPSKRGVYSFCMCPGGYVVNASSEEGLLAVNGMSYHSRAGENANSAMIVTVSPEDYLPYSTPEAGVLAGVDFQRYLETRAYAVGRGKIPVQTFADFCRKEETTSFGQVSPCMRGGFSMANVAEIFPEVIWQSLAEGIAICGRKIEGFDRPDALLSGVESRTSSPVRILRDETFQSSILGLYPCGEGAGYAGGITSAAMDGLKVAEAVCKKYMNFL